MPHHIISSTLSSSSDLAPDITALLSASNFTIVDVSTGKAIRSGFAFVTDPDPVHRAAETTGREVAIALDVLRHEQASHLAVCPRLDGAFDFLAVALTDRREEAIEATLSTGFSSYFNATTRRTTTVRHNVAEE